MKKGAPWEEWELDFLRKHIPRTEITVEDIARHVDRSYDAVYRMSRKKLGLFRPRQGGGGKVADAILAAAAKPGGTTCRIPGYATESVTSRAGELCKKGLLFSLPAWRATRYFTTEAARDAASKVVTPRAKKKPEPIKTRPGWGPSDPMHFTPHTKYTIAPPPKRALRTNTHSPL